MHVILLAAGALVSLNGIFLCMLSNLNLGVILTAFLGVFFLGCGVFYDKIRELTQKGVLKAVKITMIFLLCAGALLSAFIAVYGAADNVDYKEDAVIVLGAGIRGDTVSLPLKMRLDKAVIYHEKNPEALIVVTGGQGFQETVTEASAMEKYLIQQGVKSDVIIKEEKATSTNENMRFSKEILDEHLGGEYRVAVVTNNFHIYRGVSIAKLEGFEAVTHMHAGLQWYNILPCYIRETLAVLKMWTLG